MIRDAYRMGLHLMFCERCGATFYSNQIRREWTGAMVCDGPGTRNCWEPRQPVDSLRVIPDHFAVQGARPRELDFDALPSNKYVAIDYIEGDDVLGFERYILP